MVARRRRSCRAASAWSWDALGLVSVQPLELVLHSHTVLLLLKLDELVGSLLIAPAPIRVALLSASNQPTGDPLDVFFDLAPLRAAWSASLPSGLVR